MKDYAINDIAPAFRNALKRDGKAQEAIDVVRNISSGYLWLIGGYVFRTIAQELYGIPKKTCDLDFIVTADKKTDFPGWRRTENSYYHARLIKNDLSIDIIPLKDITTKKLSHLKPTMVHFLWHTPLDIQAIIYDVHSGNVYGAGMRALLTKRVAINSQLFLNQELEHRKKQGRPITQETYIKMKTGDLGFTLVQSNPARSRFFS